MRQFICRGREINVETAHFRKVGLTRFLFFTSRTVELQDMVYVHIFIKTTFALHNSSLARD